MVREIFRTRNMRNLTGNAGIAHVRYPTAGSASNAEEAQPFYVNAPFGITLGHNGNLTNTAELIKDEMFRKDRRHINTKSDSEVLLNVLAHELQERDDQRHARSGDDLRRGGRPASACARRLRLRRAHRRARHPGVPRPVRHPAAVLRRQGDRRRHRVHGGERIGGARGARASSFVRDVEPGEAIFIDIDSNFHAQQCAERLSLNPCIFEYVYFARPDSIMDGVSVYCARLKHGRVPGREDPRARCAAARSTSSCRYRTLPGRRRCSWR